MKARLFVPTRASQLPAKTLLPYVDRNMCMYIHIYMYLHVYMYAYAYVCVYVYVHQPSFVAADVRTLRVAMRPSAAPPLRARLTRIFISAPALQFPQCPLPHNLALALQASVPTSCAISRFARRALPRHPAALTVS